MNQSDSERIQSVFDGMNFERTQVEEDADLLGVVACSVRQKAIDRVYGKIKLWNEWKRKKSIITFVSGCILPEDQPKFLKKFDLLFRMNEIAKLPE
jgi:tRNA-2-methylthio-N6-dimethylallyladenosine synthase